LTSKERVRQVEGKARRGWTGRSKKKLERAAGEKCSAGLGHSSQVQADVKARLSNRSRKQEAR
jgi:hypothetical protein